VVIVLCPMCTVELPSSAVKITRNINGNAKVKKARAGLRQNALLTKPTCETVALTGFTARPPLG